MNFIEKMCNLCYFFSMKTRNEKLLLLSCCAPCSVGVIQTLACEGKNFAVVFFNPNIRPLAEYEKRRDENKRICDLYNIPFIELPYDTCAWDKATSNLLNEPERGKRCDKCFELRLIKTAQYAKENGYTAFSSVLGISRYKDMDQVNRAAQKASKSADIPYDFTNWRKNGGEQLRTELSKELNLYNQRYCGCKPR